MRDTNGVDLPPRRLHTPQLHELDLKMTRYHFSRIADKSTVAGLHTYVLTAHSVGRVISGWFDPPWCPH